MNKDWKNIPDTGKFFWSFPSYFKSDSYRDIVYSNPDHVAEFLTRWAKANPSKDTKWIINDGVKKLGSDKQKQILRLL